MESHDRLAKASKHIKTGGLEPGLAAFLRFKQQQMWISTEKHASCWRTEQFAMASYMDLAIEDGDSYSYNGILMGKI